MVEGKIINPLEAKKCRKSREIGFKIYLGINAFGLYLPVFYSKLPRLLRRGNLLWVTFLPFIFFNEGGYEGGQIVHNTDIGNVKNGCIRVGVDGYNKSRAPHA